jgi:excisionase family DNA binding protein
MTDMISIGDTAKTLGVEYRTVHRWARQGKLHGVVQTGGAWRVPRAEVDRLLMEREATSRLGPAAWIPMTERKGKRA